MSALHTPTAVIAVAPSGPGALAGFESRCPCGLVIRSSLRTIAEADVREHVAWFAGQPVRGITRRRSVSDHTPAVSVEDWNVGEDESPFETER
jgi:hypothetical protein